MDQNNQPTPNSPQENTDLNKQYQDILDRYSKEISPVESAPPIAPIETQLPVEQPIASPLAIETQPPVIAELPVVESTEPSIQPPIESTFPHELPPPLSTSTPDLSEPLPPQPNNPVESFTPPTPPVEAQLQEVPPSGGGFFKFLFFFSLLVFLGVFGTIAYTVFYKGQLPEFISGPAPTVTETQPSPTITSDFCDVNDKIVKKGETIPAADGCNTCTCGDDLTISCTAITCDATKSSSLSPTAKPSTPSSIKASPTVKPTTTSAVPKN